MAKRNRKKKRPSSPLQRLGRGLYRTLVILSALIVGAWIAFKVASRRPTTADDTLRPNQSVTTDDPNTQDVDESQGLQRKDGTWTFLLAAEDQVSGSTDTIMVCTYDTVNQKIGLVSLPRDTLVDRRVGPYHYHKLNAAFPNGNIANPPDGGIAELMAAATAGQIEAFGGSGIVDQMFRDFCRITGVRFPRSEEEYLKMYLSTLLLRRG